MYICIILFLNHGLYGPQFLFLKKNPYRATAYGSNSTYPIARSLLPSRLAVALTFYSITVSSGILLRDLIVFRICFSLDTISCLNHPLAFPGLSPRNIPYSLKSRVSGLALSSAKYLALWYWCSLPSFISLDKTSLYFFSGSAK